MNECLPPAPAHFILETFGRTSSLETRGDWKWEEAGSPSARDLVAAMFEEQIEAQEGVDFTIGETFWRLEEARLCLEVIKKHTSVPSMITVSFRGGDKTEDGDSPAEGARILTAEGTDVVGTNCMRDPKFNWKPHHGDEPAVHA